MSIKSEKDFWSGIMFMAIGVGFAWGATNYNFGTSARPGPGYFPFGLGVLMSVLGAMVLFKALTFEVEGGDKIGHIAWRPLLIIVGSVAAFGVLLPLLGLYIALPLLIISSALASDEFHWKDALVNAAVLTVGSWFIFIYGLKLTLPLLPRFMAG